MLEKSMELRVKSSGNSIVRKDLREKVYMVDTPGKVQVVGGDRTMSHPDEPESNV